MLWQPEEIPGGRQLCRWRGVCLQRAPLCPTAEVPEAPLAQLCCGVWYSQHPTTSAGSSPAGWETWRDPSPLPRSTRNSGLCLAVGCRRCSGMASCFNSSGPAQTYVMGRVWACSRTLLAGVPFPLDPLQFAFAAGIGWGIPGVLGASPGVMWGPVNCLRHPAFPVKSREKGVLRLQT